MARKRTTPPPDSTALPGQPPQAPIEPDTTEPATPTEGGAPAEGPAAGSVTERPYNVDLQDVGKVDPDYRFAHAYLNGPYALNAAKTYEFLYPGVKYDTACTEGSRRLSRPKVQAHVRAIASSGIFSREFIQHELTREITRRVTRKTRQVVTQDGDIITLSQTEERDRVPALTLAADILGMRKGPEVQGVTVHVHMGADLALDDAPPLDVTPASDSIE